MSADAPPRPSPADAAVAGARPAARRRGGGGAGRRLGRLAAGPAASPRSRAATALPAPAVAPAFTPGPPVALPAGRHVSRWARGPAARRRRAAPGSVRGRASPALGLRTPEGTPESRRGGRRAAPARTGRPWVRVRLAILPNGSTGWVPRTALGGYRRRADAAPRRPAAPPGHADAERPHRAARAGRGRRRRAGRRRPARSTMRNQPEPLPQPGVRAGRVRHQRALAHGDRLARRRLRRHPRHRPPGPRPGPRVARLHPDAQRRHPRARPRGCRSARRS